MLPRTSAGGMLGPEVCVLTAPQAGREGRHSLKDQYLSQQREQEKSCSADLANQGELLTGIDGWRRISGAEILFTHMPGKHASTAIHLCWQAVRLALSLGSGHPKDGKHQSGILQSGIVPCYPTLDFYQRSVLPSCYFWKAKEGGVVPTHIIILHKEINWYLIALQVSRAWSRMVVKQQSPPLPNHNHFLLAPSRPYLWGTDTLSITICPWNNVFVRAGRNTCHEQCQWYLFVYIFPKSPQNSTNADNFFVSRASKTILCPSRAYTFLFCYCCILRWMRFSFSEVHEFWR